MEKTNRIQQALDALRFGANEKHTGEIGLVREAANKLIGSNEEIITEIESAIDLYTQGRWQIADKLAEATALVGRLPTPRQDEPLPRFLDSQRSNSLEVDVTLNLYGRDTVS